MRYKDKRMQTDPPEDEGLFIELDPVTVPDAVLVAAISKAVSDWVKLEIHGSPIAHTTAAYNHLHNSLGALREGLAKEIKPVLTGALQGKE